MKRWYLTALVVFGFLCAFSAGEARSADGAATPPDLTLMVPVKLSNLRPEVVSAFIYCNISGITEGEVNTRIADISSPPLTPSNGVVNTTVKLEIHLDEKSKYGYMKYRYDCQLLLGDSSKKAYPPNTHPWNAVEPGTASRVIVTGEFP